MLKKTYRLNYGDALSPFYGVAWIDQCRLQAVCYPVGLNLIMRVLHAVYLWALVPGSVVTERQMKQRIHDLEYQLDHACKKIREYEGWPRH